MNTQAHKMLSKSCLLAPRNMINTAICRSLCFGHAPWPCKSSLCGEVKEERLQKCWRQNKDVRTVNQHPESTGTAHLRYTRLNRELPLRTNEGCSSHPGAAGSAGVVMLSSPGTKEEPAISRGETHLMPLTRALSNNHPPNVRNSFAASLFLLCIIFSQCFLLSVWEPILARQIALTLLHLA